MIDFSYELDFYPGSRRIRSAVFHLVDPDGQKHQIDLETLYTFRMRGIGYTHPQFGHGSIHGELEVGHEAIRLDDFPDPDPTTWHMQNVVVAHGGSHGHRRARAGVDRPPRAHRPHRVPRPRAGPG